MTTFEEIQKHLEAANDELEKAADVAKKYKLHSLEGRMITVGLKLAGVIGVVQERIEVGKNLKPIKYEDLTEALLDAVPRPQDQERRVGRLEN